MATTGETSFADGLGRGRRVGRGDGVGIHIRGGPRLTNKANWARSCPAEKLEIPGSRPDGDSAGGHEALGRNWMVDATNKPNLPHFSAENAGRRKSRANLAQNTPWRGVSDATGFAVVTLSRPVVTLSVAEGSGLVRKARHARSEMSRLRFAALDMTREGVWLHCKGATSCLLGKLEGSTTAAMQPTKGLGNNELHKSHE